MNQMVCVSSFAPFLSLSPSPSPSKSPFASRQSLCLVSNMFPKSKSQPRIITTSTDFLSNINFDDYFCKIGKARRGCGKADAISGQEGEAGEEGCVPHVIAYNTLIDVLCKEGKIDKALDILDMMISKGHEPDVVTYSTIIYGLCKKGEIDKAIDILHDMISKGLEPNVVTYNTLIDGLCKKRDIDFHKWVMISEGHEPKVVIYNTLVCWLLRKGEIEKAADVLDVMISKGCEQEPESILREMGCGEELDSISREMRGYEQVPESILREMDCGEELDSISKR